MTMTEEMTKFIGTIIISLIVIVVFFFLINHYTGGKLVKFLVCSALFWIPFGAAAATHCHAIPV
ncbi:MAG: hypothetical protein GTN40_04945 [Candidatus Aenigmarchaeota archaeon]|nr:hypothetical protein [Candidatus Aenigmarchaeota archaeon]